MKRWMLWQRLLCLLMVVSLLTLGAAASAGLWAGEEALPLYLEREGTVYASMNQMLARSEVEHRMVYEPYHQRLPSGEWVTGVEYRLFDTLGSAVSTLSVGVCDGREEPAYRMSDCGFAGFFSTLPEEILPVVVYQRQVYLPAQLFEELTTPVAG